MAYKFPKTLTCPRVIDSVTIEEDKESPELHFAIEIKGCFDAQELFDEIRDVLYEMFNPTKSS